MCGPGRALSKDLINLPVRGLASWFDLALCVASPSVVATA